MDMRVLLFLFIFGSSWCCNARDLTADHFTGTNELVSVHESYSKQSEREAQYVEDISKEENLCSYCEEFSAEALNYLLENKTQTEIINILHKSCSRIPTFKEQCINLVDYYGPLFFMEVYLVQPDAFCHKVGLCGKSISISHHVSKDKCDLCHNVVTEALLKLKDPDTELEIVELLLKACNSIGKRVKKCKRLVFEYAPIILIDAEKFLETNDICSVLHVCDSDDVVAEQELIEAETPLHSAS